MGVFGKAGRAAGQTLINSNPVTRAAGQVLGALGIGSVRNARGESLSGLKKAIAQGDWATVKRKAAQSKWAKVRGIAQTALETGAQDYQVNKATYYARKGGAAWPSSNGPAPAAGSSSAPVSRTGASYPSPSRSAPAAKKRKALGTKAAPKGTSRGATAARGKQTLAGVPTGRPCAYGPRDAMNRCPKAPCKYGPRDAMGRCPPAPKASAADKAIDRTITKAVTAGGTAAAGVARTVVKTISPGVVVSLVARGTLLLGAGLAAYYITSKLMNLRYRTYAELRKEAADAYRHSRQEAAASLGRPLNREELAQLASYFKARMSVIDAHEAAGHPVSGVANLTFED